MAVDRDDRLGHLKVEVASAGHYQLPNFGSFDEIQVLAIEGLLDGTDRDDQIDLAPNNDFASVRLGG